MAKKNKKKQSTAENNGVIDINQSVVNMEPIKSEAEKADVSAKDSEDDEFEQLLNSFLNSDADNRCRCRAGKTQRFGKFAYSASRKLCSG